MFLIFPFLSVQWCPITIFKKKRKYPTHMTQVSVWSAVSDMINFLQEMECLVTLHRTVRFLKKMIIMELGIEWNENLIESDGPNSSRHIRMTRIRFQYMPSRRLVGTGWAGWGWLKGRGNPRNRLARRLASLARYLINIHYIRLKQGWNQLDDAWSSVAEEIVFGTTVAKVYL